jgi:hypothetical protein
VLRALRLTYVAFKDITSHFQKVNYPLLFQVLTTRSSSVNPRPRFKPTEAANTQALFTITPALNGRIGDKRTVAGVRLLKI